MVCRCLLSCLLLLVAVRRLLSHHISDSSEMSYQGPASVEEDQVVSPQELSLSDQAYISQNAPGFGFPSLLPERNSLRPSDPGPNQAAREVLLEKPGLNPLTRLLRSRTDYRKRTTTECFWKYCV